MKKSALSLIVILASLSLLQAAPWTPPIGIPEPPFGIHETVKSVYGSDSYYTYWVDNSAACSDSNNSGKGSSAAPRCTIPTSLSAGDVVQIAGGAYSGTTLSLSGTGTASQPIFVRGMNPNNKPQIQYADLVTNAQYMVVENLHFTATRWNGSSNATHFSFRHNEMRGPSGKNGLEPLAVDTAIYNNHIHHAGYDLAGNPARGDRHGITLQAASKRVWIVDNDIHHASGDGVQFCHNCPMAPEFIYIGRNTIHDNIENAVDFKISKNIVVSQNIFYGFRAVDLMIGGSQVRSDGAAVLIGSNGLADPPMNVWIFFNQIYDSESGVRVEAAASAAGVIGPAYLIGNKIHNIVKTTGKGAAFLFEKDSVTHVISNTVYDADRAIVEDVQPDAALRIFNNIFASLRGSAGNHIHIVHSQVAARSSMSHNLFYQNGDPVKINWGGTTHTIASTTGFSSFPGGVNNLLEDPSFVNPAANDFHLRAGGAAIDKANYALYDYASEFCATFGPYIPDCVNKMRVDFDNKTRLQGAAWDIGAYEFDSGNPPPPADTKPPARPTGLKVK